MVEIRDGPASNLLVGCCEAPNGLGCLVNYESNAVPIDTLEAFIDTSVDVRRGSVSTAPEFSAIGSDEICERGRAGAPWAQPRNGLGHGRE